MKILRIEGENIASLYGPFSVDFTKPPLANAGVFAICGPTGSGKSTLLDAMCLALYGRTPRLRGLRKGDLMIGEFSATEDRSLLSRGCNHGFAAVEFESAQGQFRAEWIVEKPKRALKDKTTKPSDCRLFQIHAPGHHTLVDLKHREIAEFIGLDFEQFTRTALLAQGEFRKFLDSTGDERSKLLEKLTATQVYAEIGKAAFERHKKEVQARQTIELRLQGIQCLSQEERETLTTELAEIQARISELRKQDEQSQNALRWYHSEQELSSAEQQSAIQLQSIVQKWSASEAEFKDLADWERSEALRTSLQEWRRLDEERKDLEQKIPFLKTRHASLAEQKVQLDQQQKQFTDRKEDFAKKQLQTEKDLVQAEALDKEIAQAKKDHERNVSERERIGKRLVELLKNLRKSKETLQGNTLPSIRTAIDQLLRRTEQLRAAKESLEVYLRHRASLAQELSEASQEVQNLRNALVRGTPCPVCGGLEHPATLQNPLDEREELQKLLLQMLQQEQSLRSLQGIAETLPTQYEQLRELRIQWFKVRPLERANRVQLQQSSSLRNNLLQGIDATQVRSTLQRESQEIQRQEIDLQTKLQNNIKEFSQTGSQLQDLQQRQIDNTNATKVIHEIMAQQRAELGFSDERSRQIVRMNSVWIQDIRNKRNQLQLEQNRLEGRIEQLREQLQKLREIPPGISKPQAETLQMQCKELLEPCNRKERELSSKLMVDSQNLQQSQSLQKSLESQKQQEERWGRLSNVIGSADGAKFREFAQSITLRRLTAQANQHLARLHSRYKLQAWANMELVIEDLDMGGEIRSTRSLSGGEGFLVSMALALGLSDMAGKQTRIGSLFIDEGFGTLDTETLQTVVSVLEELRQQGRMVGIISHVEGLARQLGASIQITPLGNGKSLLNVC